jgi:hypothetical protein
MIRAFEVAKIAAISKSLIRSCDQTLVEVSLVPALKQVQHN